jgi:hypothetical protein
MTLGAYEAVGADPTLFFVSRGHELPEIEVVLPRTDDYQVVRKDAEHDPRGETLRVRVSRS